MYIGRWILLLKVTCDFSLFSHMGFLVSATFVGIAGKERLGWAGQERSKTDPGMPSIPDPQCTRLTESALNTSSSKVQSTFKVLPNNGLEATNLSGKGASLPNRLESHDSFNRGSDKVIMPSNIKGAGMASTSRDAERPTQDASSEELGTLKSEGQNRQAINVFEGHLFGFTDNYPVDQVHAHCHSCGCL